MERYYGLTAETYRAVVALVDDRVEEMRVTRQDYDHLVQAQEHVEGRMERVEAALDRLAEAQARTDTTVQQLVQAQVRAEKRAGRLEEGQVTLQAALDRLAQAQARAEERAGRLEEGQVALQEGQVALQASLERLAQAQARTEERAGRLEEGQIALQAALERLTQAQVRTEEAVDRLGGDQNRTGIALGSLAENIGFGLEDVARLMLPPYLSRHHGIQLKGLAGEELQRRFFSLEGRPPAEIDLYGEGQRNGQWVVVLGEAKARIGGGTVKHFADVLEQVEPLVEGEVWRVMFGYYIHPSALPVAEEHHILLVASYQR
jgi:hypothetical protein